jgi:hypothetical protein
MLKIVIVLEYGYDHSYMSSTGIINGSKTSFRRRLEYKYECQKWTSCQVRSKTSIFIDYSFFADHWMGTEYIDSHYYWPEIYQVVACTCTLDVIKFLLSFYGHIFWYNGGVLRTHILRYRSFLYHFLIHTFNDFLNVNRYLKKKK